MPANNYMDTPLIKQKALLIIIVGGCPGVSNPVSVYAYNSDKPPIPGINKNWVRLKHHSTCKVQDYLMAEPLQWRYESNPICGIYA